MVRYLLGLACVMVMAAQAWAGPPRTEDVTRLIKVLRLDDTLAIMQEEGVVFGDELAADFLDADRFAHWRAIVRDIYDPGNMGSFFQTALEEGIDDWQLAELLDFFAAPRGQRIVELEIAARQAFLDPEIEAHAVQRWYGLEEEGNARLSMIKDYVTANDLIEFNVSGALNSGLGLLQGLVDGGAFAMTQAEMLDEVWGQEAAIRAETEAWMYGYLVLAYQPLSDDDLRAYIDLSKSPAGRALNRALFDGFDRMYSKVTVALGLAMARQLQMTDL